MKDNISILTDSYKSLTNSQEIKYTKKQYPFNQIIGWNVFKKFDL